MRDEKSEEGRQVAPTKSKKESDDMPHSKRSSDLIVALDFPRSDWALKFVDQLEDLPVIYKVGYELFIDNGPEIVRELVHRKKRVFLDLKFHDIPNTVMRAVRQAALLHVDMLTLHLAGGSAMVKAAAEELSKIPALRPKILGVSVLTSFDDVRWAEVSRALTGHAVDVSESVDGLLRNAVPWGVDGVVCSAHELTELTAAYPNLYTVVPGIRPEGYEGEDDQARVVTPARARELGARAIVMGRPIIESENPRMVAENVLKQLSAKQLSA